MDSTRFLEQVLESTRSAAITTIRGMPEYVGLVAATAKLMHDLAGAGGEPARDAAHEAVRSLVSYSSFFYVSTIQNAISCQTYAVPVLTRSTIECIAYAARCRDEPEAATAWRRRHRDYIERARQAGMSGAYPDISEFMTGDTENRRASRRHFERQRLAASLGHIMAKAEDGPEIAEALLKRYELSIDMGAHPNVLMTMIATESFVPDEGELASRVHYMVHGDAAVVQSSLDAICTLGALVVRVMMVLLPECAVEVDAARRLHHLGRQFQAMRPGRGEDRG